MLQNTQEETITATTINRKFGDIAIGLLQGKKYVLERNGKQLGAVIPMQTYEMIQKQQRNFFQALDSIQSSFDMPEDEGMELANEIVAEVRKEQLHESSS